MKTITTKKLQYQQSSGTWYDVDPDRVDEFLQDCIDNNDDVNTPAEAIEVMEQGQTLRNYPDDWYRNCRLFDSVEHERRMAIVEERQQKLYESQKSCSDCGQRGVAGQYPFSTIANGNICDDCL